MRMLTNNLLESNSSIIIADVDTNYPVENIYNNFLEDIVQASAASTVITVDFAVPVDVNCLFFGWHNASSVIVTFKDALNVVLKVSNFVYPDLNVKEYFTLISGIRKIEIALLTSESYVFIGNFSCGVYTQIYNVVIPMLVDYVDSSLFTQTFRGQALYNTGITLQSFNVDCYPLTDEQFAAFKAAYAFVHKGKAFWLDRYEELEDEHLFVIFDANYQASRVDNRIKLNFSIKEVR